MDSPVSVRWSSPAYTRNHDIQVAFMIQDIPRDGDWLCTIRQSLPEDWQALRLLLPEAVHFGASVTSLIATPTSRRARKEIYATHR